MQGREMRLVIVMKELSNSIILLPLISRNGVEKITADKGMRGEELENFIYKTDGIKLLMDDIKQLMDMEDEYHRQ